MFRVALTGGIATGKSYVRARIASMGVGTVDADSIAHALLVAGSEAVAPIAERFGTVMVLDDGSIDRRALGAVVFHDAVARRDLEAIVHPRVYRQIAEWEAEQSRAGARWVVEEIALLFETGHDRGFDRVIVAACPAREQLQRVMRRDGLSESAASARLASQWPIDEKIRRATDVVDTSGTFEDTDRHVDEIVARIVAAFGL